MNNDISKANENMKPFLQEAWKESGFEAATEVQKRTSAVIDTGRDVIVEAPTGSGKTLAYLLPLLQNIDPTRKQIQVVIMASSHELVMQIHQEIGKWSKGSGISSATLIGGANINRQIDKLKKKPQIVAGTPGRILELINKKKIKMHEVQTLVLDEADQLLVQEHISAVKWIVKSTQKDRHLLVFSATVPKAMEDIAKELMVEPEVIRIQESETNKPKADHVYIVCDPRDMINTLVKVTNISGAKVLAFRSDIASLTVLAEKLTFKGLDVGVLHSDTKKEQREKALKTFRASEKALLLATDIAARGLDIADLNYVVNIGLPRETTQYIHRAGRTGRLGSTEGTVISIIEPSEMKHLNRIAKEFGIELQEKVFYKGELTDAK